MTAKLILAAALAFAASNAQTAQRSATPPPSAVKPAGPSQLPPGAEKVSEGVYRVKDSAGKTWIYTRTPFGFSRGEEGAAPAAPVPAPVEFRILEVKDDTVRFERDTPFGKSVWTRRVADLDEKEKAAYESRKTEAPKARQ